MKQEMKKPDKIYVHRGVHLGMLTTTVNRVDAPDEEEYIRKDALLVWVESEMERLWELLPDADNSNPTQMELRYLGQYMQMEALDHL